MRSAAWRKFKSYPLGYFHINIAEVRTDQGKRHLFVGIDRTGKFAFVELHEEATMRIVGVFLRHLIKAVHYTMHTVVTDIGIQFTTSGGVKPTTKARPWRASLHRTVGATDSRLWLPDG